MDQPALTPTSYLVLGLVGRLGVATPYELKQRVANSIGYFWTFPHSQLYAEPVRLTDLGLLAEQREDSGRKRRRYSITDRGRDALEAWLAEPTEEPTELRDLAVLKLFFGSQTKPDHIRALAESAQKAHERRLAEYQAIADEHREGNDWSLTTLALGLRYERAAAAFWRELAIDPSPINPE